MFCSFCVAVRVCVCVCMCMCWLHSLENLRADSWLPLIHDERFAGDILFNVYKSIDISISIQILLNVLWYCKSATIDH